MMKQVKTMAAVAALLIAGTTTLQAQNTRTLESFEGISVHEGIEVILEKGNTNRAEIDADGVDLDEVLTEIRSGVLKVHLDGNNHRNVDVTVTITYTEDLESLKVSSAGSITCDDWLDAGDIEIGASSAGHITAKIKDSDIEIDASSAAVVDLEVDGGDMEVDMSSSASIKLQGDTGNIDIDGSSAGSVEAFDLQAVDADIRVSSGAHAKVHVTGELDGSASSGGSIRFKGDPAIDVSTSSGGSVRKG